MPLAADQVQISRASGSLLMGPGTAYTVLPGWDPWSRTVRAEQGGPRPEAHGSWVGSEWMEEAVVLIPVSVYRDGSSKTAWLEAHKALMAAFSSVGSSGEMVELAFEHGGGEYLMFGRPRQVRVDAENIAVGKSVEQCAFVAADPRIYSSTLYSTSLGLPEQSGGLTVPFTVPVTVTGRLSGGRAVLTNTGTTATSLVFRIDGPAPDPRIVLTGPDGVAQVIDFGLTLGEGQWLKIDTTTHLALLNGLSGANQRGRAEWTMDTHPLLPGTSTLRFFAAGVGDAQLSAEWRHAWL